MGTNQFIPANTFQSLFNAVLTPKPTHARPLTMRMARLAVMIFLLFFLSSGAGAREKLVIGTGLKPPLVPSTESPGFLDQLVTEAFNRINMRVDIIIMPAERVLINANKGIEDGCLLRIKGLEKYYPDLIRVPEMLMHSEFVGYTHLKGATGGNFKVLYPYSVAYVTGWKIFDRHLTGHPAVMQVKNASQLFLLLKNRRADIVLYERWQGLWVLRDLGVEHVSQLNPPFIKMEMFMYLHRRHKKTVPKLAAALSEIKQDGTYQRYYDRYLQALVNK